MTKPKAQKPAPKKAEKVDAPTPHRVVTPSIEDERARASANLGTPDR